MSTNGKPSTRASSSRAASQSATHEQPNVSQLPDAIDPQDNAPVTMAMFLQQLSTQVQASATQVQSVMQAFNSEQPPPVAHGDPSAHFSKPARFSGNDFFNTDKINISWVASHFTETALDWHWAEIRNYDLDAPTAWETYSEALIQRFTDPGANEKNYQRMLSLKYEGDTHAYLTKFLELNTSGQSLGLGERSAIRKALPHKIVDTMNIWREGRVLSDNEFIDLLKTAGANYEEDRTTSAASQLTRRRPPLPLKTDKGTPKSTIGNFWTSLKEALAGIVQSAIDQRKTDGKQCWRTKRIEQLQQQRSPHVGWGIKRRRQWGIQSSGLHWIFHLCFAVFRMPFKSCDSGNGGGPITSICTTTPTLFPVGFPLINCRLDDAGQGLFQ
ncbi:uncharacterized protein CPUR_08439 [Claviceps purpurea 20.1]|uniref:Retrotransposon gag domain-containing protein n=1 Tax=Claviceps purpurea (strain 20.1) TaxID=1111077 RepID=M1VZ07_CLAP2|nr:uncharacterized protein CPUR_08439 [Claviceps purpurea 20.1]